MSQTTTIADEAERLRALDPSQSFIVQAPAGSGKTGLITQRFLVLLAGVEAPEEIVAITFTRKAAGEMRNRILEALHAASRPPPQDAHARRSWELARAALARDAARGWNLLQTPARLRVQTIDAFCASLTRQMPLLSRFGAPPAMADDAQPLYREAAQLTLADLERGENWSPAIGRLLRHLDNNLAAAEEMLVTMLARRDHWLRHLVHIRNEPERRRVLESALQHVIHEALMQLRQAFPSGVAAELVPLLRFAAANVAEDHAIAACADLTALPGNGLDALVEWHGIAAALLTADKKWRRKIDKDIGFPPPSGTKDKAEIQNRKQKKAAMTTLLEQLRDDTELLQRLAALRYLPDPCYSEDQWQIIEALCELLLVAAAHLRVVFAQRGMVDFSEVAQSALVALGDAEAPTDLALALDYRLSHLLVDEFQDTSFGQFALLERLTAGWQAGDGRTLFVVGDPMQSIYRFREAEVGLYLRARERGIGQIRLEPLRLQVNFRSQGGIVDWVNAAFARLFPAGDDSETGAVSYAASVAHHAADEAAVAVHPALEHDPVAEAAHVVTLIRQAREEEPAATVAVLVRARGHLLHIIEALRQAGLRYRAIEIEHLAHRPVVQDLVSLTRALLHRGDRLAWLAILRAPWCGLELADMAQLAEATRPITILDALTDGDILARLSAPGRQRVSRLLDVVGPAIGQRGRGLRRWVEAVWCQLGGPACCTSATDLEDADVFLDLLDALDQGADLEDFAVLQHRLDSLFALADVEADESLQLMTIHKSKGLEFDTVIVPALGRRPPNADQPLLRWTERTSEDRGTELVLAPLRPAGARAHGATYAYLQQLEAERGKHEALRLLYVAATRARRRLHWLGHTGIGIKGETRAPKTPQARSLLALLWPVMESYYVAAVADLAANDVGTAERSPQTPRRVLQRLSLAWRPPSPPAAVELPPPNRIASYGADTIEFLWAGEVARHVGTVVHRYLQWIAEQGLVHWTVQRIRAEAPRIATALARLGVGDFDLAQAGERVQQALSATVGDARGRWLFDPAHAQACNEFALSGVYHGRIVDVRVDRTFIDAKGVRWIIDYKTGVHEGADREAFLDREMERYRHQLECYATLMAAIDPRPVRVGLYFPLLLGWREWQMKETA